VLVALLLGLVHALNRYEFYKWEVPDIRQYLTPQITEGQRGFGREVATEERGSIQRFDVVCFKIQRSAETTSRVVGLPGERIEISDGKLLINGADTKNVYANFRGGSGELVPEILVPADCVFVLNDQRGKGQSSRMDSRELGPIPTWSITYRFGAKPPLGGR
jgi:signal peptidase I